jgi:F0F1-type ATP synthase membrane subunit b/b'
MEETLRALGGVLLRAIPTFLLVVFLHFYLKAVFFGPLKKVLKDRYDATDGARKMADASLARAAEKAAEYEAALRAARAETYKELEQLRRQLQEERAAGVREARARADAQIAEARASLHAETAALKQNLEAESEALADRIAAKILRRPAA